MSKFNRRANGPTFYAQTERYRLKGLPHKAPVPGYTGYFQGMNMDFGVSKAFGLPIELMEIPKTPDAFREEFDDMLGQGFGPNGKHKMGMQGLYAGKAYADKKKMMEALRIQRITGHGGKVPYDFLPTDGLITECHIYADSVGHRFPPGNNRVSYISTNATGAQPGRLRRTKKMTNKGFAPPTTRLVQGSVGTTKFSVFNLPTMTDVTTRKAQYTRV